MKPAAAARLARLYPARWRERYGGEFAALLEDHPRSLTVLMDIICSALEAHMESWQLERTKPAGMSAVLWCAWMAAVAAGISLYGMVDDSPFVGAMQSNLSFGVYWLGIEVGCLVTAGAIALGGAVAGWSMLRFAIASRRRDILWRLAYPLLAHLALAGWLVTILIATGGRWAPSPWAVAVSRPGWPSEGFRQVTGSISAGLWLAALAGSAWSIGQALNRSQFPSVRLWSGAKFEIQPMRFAASLAPWAAAGMAVMFCSAVLWGIAANRYAPAAFGEPLGPLGLANWSSWLISVILFGAAALISAQAAWRWRRLGSDRA